MVFVLGDAISWGTNLIQEVVKFQDLGVTEVHLSSFMVLLHIQADLGYVKLHVDEQSVGNEKFGILWGHLSWIDPLVENNLLLDQSQAHKYDGDKIQNSDEPTTECLFFTSCNEHKVSFNDFFGHAFAIHLSMYHNNNYYKCNEHQ